MAKHWKRRKTTASWTAQEGWVGWWVGRITACTWELTTSLAADNSQFVVLLAPVSVFLQPILVSLRIGFTTHVGQLFYSCWSQLFNSRYWLNWISPYFLQLEKPIFLLKHKPETTQILLRKGPNLSSPCFEVPVPAWQNRVLFGGMLRISRVLLIHTDITSNLGAGFGWEFL